LSLALHGGTPALPEGPPDWPLADAEVRAAMEAAFADGTWGRYEGPHGEQLAARLGEMHGLPYALPCSSGTFAVELALRGLRVGNGDDVLLAGYDFPGNFRAVEAVGARPVLVDLAPGRWHADVDSLREAVTPAARAVIVSHLHGTLAPMGAIRALAAERGLAVVEDACQVSGAIVEGRPAGSAGDAGVMSFGGSKLLTAGRGGAILTARQDVHQRAKVYCERANNAFPLSELQAAVLLPQLAKLEERNATRLANARRLVAALRDVPALAAPADQATGSRPAFYKLGWFYLPEHCGGAPRETFLAAVRAEGVALDAGFRGFVLRPASRARKDQPLENSRRAADATVLLHHPVLLENAATVDRVAGAVRKVVAALAAGAA
jgi:perosamine synthetase